MKNYHNFHILGIAPYDGLKTLMIQTKRKYPNIDLDVFTGNLDEGAKIAKQLETADYDAIISRGGTAKLISQVTSLPVIDLKLTAYDILRAIKLTEAYTRQHAIVGYAGITSDAKQLCELLQYKIDIYTAHDSQELTDILISLKSKGYTMVLGDMATYTASKKIGLNAILITSGQESMQTAFEHALNICYSRVSLNKQMELLKRTINGFSDYAIIFDENQNIILSSLPAELDTSFQSYLLSKNDALSRSSSLSFFKNVRNCLYSVNGKTLILSDKHYYIYYIDKSKTPLTNGKYGLTFLDRSETEEAYYRDLTYFIEDGSGFIDMLDSYAKTNRPVIIYGEYGTGKNQAARQLYLKSTSNNSSFITIDFSHFNKKSWGYLTNHYNSPLNDNGNTLFFKNINHLSENERKSLLSIIIDTRLSSRNRLIFSCTENADSVKLMNDYLCSLSCLTLYMRPLRERFNDLTSYISLYLSDINLQLAKQIIGVDSEALSLMEEYNWPQNYFQFQRVLYELATLTDTSYIKASSFEQIIKKERKMFFEQAPFTEKTTISFNYDRTLEDMTIDIIRHTVAQCGGNNTLAAAKLGIGRSTLWRYLNRS